MKPRTDLKALLDECLEALRRGDIGRAETRCRRLLERAPRHPDGLHLMGCVRHAQGRTAEAARLIGDAITEAPYVAVYHENLADTLFRSGDLAGAEGECRLALRLDRSLHRPHNLLGLIAVERGDHAQAVQHLLAALEAHSPNLDALINLAMVMNRTGEQAMARDYSQLALRVAPGDPRVLINLGMAYKGLGQLAEARAAFEAAGDHPRARFDLGFTWMLEDDLERGLPLLEERKRLLGVGRGLANPEWDGARLADGTLLVIHEQGMGDTLLMARFLPRLCDTCGHVVALVQPALARLIATVDPRLEVVTSLDGVAYDRWVATMSLPFKLGIRHVSELPLAPWLAAAPDRPPGDRPRVGLNWAGNPRYAFDAVRSTHLDSFALLLHVGDVEWVSLHRGHLEREAEAYGLPQPLRAATDFLDSARAVAGCDLVISTETAIPNLSAAMGVPTCVLTGPDPDWRWGAWYAGVTVCRQEIAGDWSAPLAQSLEAVRDLLVKRQAA